MVYGREEREKENVKVTGQYSKDSKAYCDFLDLRGKRGFPK